MRQTAVEWLVEQISKEEITFTGLRAYVKFPELIQQAKEMEKQQIIKSVDYCLASIKISDDKTMFTATTAEQYYNETFKSKSYQQKMRDKIDYYKNKFKSE